MRETHQECQQQHKILQQEQEQEQPQSQEEQHIIDNRLAKIIAEKEGNREGIEKLKEKTPMKVLSQSCPTLNSKSKQTSIAHRVVIQKIDDPFWDGWNQLGKIKER